MVKNHITRRYNGIVLERMIHLPVGGKMGDLPAHLQHESFKRIGDKKTGGPNMRLLRLEMDKPALTVTAYIFNKFVHPIENRYITPREAACLQDFPIDYEFGGTLGQIQKQIGNAVPVKLGSAIANEVKQYLLKRKITGKVSIASYFTGAGGLDLGFELASDEDIQFETRFTTDIEEWAQKTININRPEWNFHLGDIRELNPKSVKSCIGEKPTIVIGGPPCQPFSVAGKQKATDDPLGVLYRDYVRNIGYLKPEIVVMENVYGLAQVKTADMISEIFKSFEDIGYKVSFRELLAADFGSPQMRRRLIFIAAKDLSKFKFPSPKYSANENLLMLPLYNGAGNSFKNLPPPEIRN